MWSRQELFQDHHPEWIEGEDDGDLSFTERTWHRPNEQMYKKDNKIWYWIQQYNLQLILLLIT